MKLDKRFILEHPLRVYPSWVTPDSLQAKKTQSWQLKYFLEIDLNNALGMSEIKQFFSI